MKKLILGLAITASSLAFAQTTTKEIIKSSSPVTFGIKGGANFTPRPSGDFIENPKGKVGFYAGGFVNIPLSEHFSIQPEVLYTMTGTKATNRYSTFSESYTTTSHLLTIPVMLQYNFTPKFYLEAGPQATILLSQNTKSIIDNTSHVDHFKSKNAFQANLAIGAGYNITPNLGINARYVTDNGLQVGLSYKFK
ncbi:porin family protein [Chryseobacterium sp. SIMBA_038]|uniref:porin family protein n=1 Tax=Chryseobacterium sp. SIMBA_038 TaxID=3085780 RepID=UPI00397E0BA9